MARFREPTGPYPDPIYTFQTVSDTFGALRAEEIRRMGTRLLWNLKVGEPERKPLGQATVEVLVGSEDAP